jgi:hypothetical protein
MTVASHKLVPSAIGRLAMRTLPTTIGGSRCSQERNATCPRTRKHQVVKALTMRDM